MSCFALAALLIEAVHLRPSIGSPLLCPIRDTSYKARHHGDVLAILCETALHLLPKLLENILQAGVIEDKVRLKARASVWQRHVWGMCDVV